MSEQSSIERPMPFEVYQERYATYRKGLHNLVMPIYQRIEELKMPYERIVIPINSKEEAERVQKQVENGEIVVIPWENVGSEYDEIPAVVQEYISQLEEHALHLNRMLRDQLWKGYTENYVLPPDETDNYLFKM